MFEDELRQLLDELLDATGALSAAIVRPNEERRRQTHVRAAASDEDGEASGDAKEAADERIVPLGNAAFLLVRFAAPESPADLEKRDAAIEKAVRALRACASRWEESALPAIVRGEAPQMPVRVLERIQSFLLALANTQHAVNAVVTLRGEMVTSAEPLEDLYQERIAFILKRIRAETDRRKGESSHAEISGDDFYAVSFWFNACLIIFFSGPFSIDFMRHRARRVTRELANLLPELDNPSLDPVQAAPVPD